MNDTRQLLAIDLPRKAGDRRVWGSLSGAGMGLALSQACLQHDSLSLMITPNSAAADQLEQELRFFLKHRDDIDILNFPDWETLPYDSFSPHQDIISQRLLTLYRLPTISRGVLIVPITTLMHRLTPQHYLHGNSLVISKGDRMDLDQQRQVLEQAGYRCVDTVYEHGEFAIRGALLDIFPMGSQVPYRIDLFDDEVDTLRTFDPETQRSHQTVDKIQLLPAKEFPLTKEAIAIFMQRFRDTFDVDFRQSPIYKDVKQGLSPAGIEYYLALFFEQCALLFDYLPKDTLVITTDQIEPATQRFWQDANERFESRRYDPERPILPPHQVFVPVEELNHKLKSFPRVVLADTTAPNKAGHLNLPIHPVPNLPVDARAEQPLASLQTFMLEQQSSKILFCAESAGRRETLLALLTKINCRPEQYDNLHQFMVSEQAIGITIAPIENSLWLNQPGLVVIAETTLFGQRVMQRRRRKKTQDQSDQIIKNLTELRIGAPVVHIDHGVGRYRGLEKLNIDNQDAEFLMLEYANEAKLYVPVSSLHLISRYTGADDALAPLHKLGTDKWSQAKRKAAEKARDVAAELLDIYARRAARQGFTFSNPDDNYEMFCAGFPFEETPDQQTAIEAVVKDMTAKQPMDRLVCGDVGFGKTEVAMRAAFLAVQSQKQVAVLVPTTLLAQQHYESFKDRFADWPVNVEVISRFKTSKETQVVQQHVAEGKVDILIGTHKLLQSDLNFKALGLLIIDEEHRFGVRQKDKLKALRSEVDILTLTATPIPRTLNMSIAGMRDLSIIATPPARRLSVKTFVRPSDKAVTKEAILRELLRGGQVYYLHNEVKTIEKTATELAELVPEARISIGHGQMRERELEQVMSDFYHKRHNVLVCTTIIETGIDIPSANTIIIDRADKFGLAQLHQLRGRVGRSHHQAYAYLLTPASKKNMTADAAKRLEAIANAQELGAGFTLATHDLEIRGAGELLGEEQSGQIQSVGFSLYMEMLNRAVKAIQQGKTPNLDKPLDQGPEVNLRLPALIPDEYIHDVHTRLIMYKRIANAMSESELDELQVELIDRFGLLPEATKHLFRITQLKLQASEIGVEKIDVGAEVGRLEFSAEAKVDPLTIVKMVQNQPQRYRLEGATILKYFETMDEPDQRLKYTERLLNELKPAA
ncbi:transcription-repair coupling factor [Spartinivicinus poritis]|uniref:Transcription-repair-coupling factor n=1 Tax=Spartinivicinus poritis TaxID=2994640 RepID=A0ABT5U896_9GAMM|nr:transcription-repair coupling factor [Spartinivicinus sp. A2-2]MDE1462590.1 transcription-repair coupling factor [Spartinivicinus sp. A2-2]